MTPEHAGQDGLRFASAQGRWVLVATVLGSALASVDATVVGIALPAIGRDFGVGMSLLQWVVTAVTLLLSARSGALAGRIGPRLQMSAGPILVGAGLALFTRITASGDYLTEVLPAVSVLGFGLAVTVAPLTATALSSAPAKHAGLASAVNNDVARGAALIAVAVLPALGGITGDAYQHPGLFSTGFHTASLVSAGLCVAGGLLAAVTIRNPAPAAVPARPSRPLRYCALDAPPAAEPAR